MDFHVCFFSLLFFHSSSNLSSHPPSVMPRFTEQVECAVEALSSNPSQPVDENEFIDASRLVYDGIRDIRKAVLMIRVSCTAFFPLHFSNMTLELIAVGKSVFNL